MMSLCKSNKDRKWEDMLFHCEDLSTSPICRDVLTIVMDYAWFRTHDLLTFLDADEEEWYFQVVTREGWTEDGDCMYRVRKIDMFHAQMQAFSIYPQTIQPIEPDCFWIGIHSNTPVFKETQTSYLMRMELSRLHSLLKQQPKAKRQQIKQTAEYLNMLRLGSNNFHRSH